MNKMDIKERMIKILGDKYKGNKPLTDEELDIGYENIHTLELTIEDMEIEQHGN